MVREGRRSAQAIFGVSMNEQQGHTPGPWAIHHDGKPLFGYWHVRQDPKDWDGMGYQAICTLPASKAGTHYGEMFRANAHLITAAPDLKAFADAILIYQVEGDDDHVWLSFGGQNIVIHKTNSAEGIALLKMEAARREAVAKAEPASLTHEKQK